MFIINSSTSKYYELLVFPTVLAETVCTKSGLGLLDYGCILFWSSGSHLFLNIWSNELNIDRNTVEDTHNTIWKFVLLLVGVSPTYQLLIICALVEPFYSVNLSYKYRASTAAMGWWTFSIKFLMRSFAIWMVIQVLAHL